MRKGGESWGEGGAETEQGHGAGEGGGGASRLREHTEIGTHREIGNG